MAHRVPRGEVLQGRRPRPFAGSSLRCCARRQLCTWNKYHRGYRIECSSLGPLAEASSLAAAESQSQLTEPQPVASTSSSSPLEQQRQQQQQQQGSQQLPAHWLTVKLKQAASLAQLHSLCGRYHGSFNAIHVATALLAVQRLVAAAEAQGQRLLPLRTRPGSSSTGPAAAPGFWPGSSLIGNTPPFEYEGPAPSKSSSSSSEGPVGADHAFNPGSHSSNGLAGRNGRSAEVEDVSTRGADAAAAAAADGPGLAAAPPGPPSPSPTASSSNSSSEPPLSPQQLLLQQLLDLCCSRALALLPSFPQQALSNTLYALACLPHYHPGLVDGCCQLAFATANELLPRHLATILWSLGRLRCQPAQPLLARLLHNTLAKLPGYNPQDLSMTLWALPQLNVEVLPSTVQQLAVAALPLLPVASAGQVAVVVAGLARLGFRPGPAWAQGLWPVLAGGVLARMSPHELAMLGWGLGSMGLAAPEGFVEQYAAAAIDSGMLRPTASSSSSESAKSPLLSNVPSAVAGAAAAAAEVDDPGLVQAAMVLFCLSRCSAAPPPKHFLDVWFVATQLPLPDQPSSSSSPASSSSSSSPAPPASPSSSVAAAAAASSWQCGRVVSSQLISSMLGAAARVVPDPPVPWLKALLWQLQQQPLPPPPPEAAAAGPTSFGQSPAAAAELVTSLWALATMRVLPSEPWMAAFTVRAALLLPSFQPVDFALLLWSFARLGYVPGSSFWSGFWPAAGELLPKGRPVDVAVALWAVAQLHTLQPEVSPPAKWLTRLLAAAGGRRASPSRQERWQQQQHGRELVQRRALLLQQQQRQQQQQQHVAAGIAAAELNLQEQQQQQQQLPALSSSSSRWQGWSGVHLVLLVHSAARLGATPTRATLDGLMAAVRRQECCLSPQAVATFVWAVAFLDSRPATAIQLASLLAATSHPPSAFSPRQLVVLLKGCSRARAVPPSSWLQQLLELTQGNMAQLGPQGQVVLLRCVARLGLRPPRSWQLALDEALQPSLLQLPLRELLPALQALVALRLVPSPGLMAVAEQCCSSMSVAVAEGVQGPQEQRQQQQEAGALAGTEASSSSSSSGSQQPQQQRQGKSVLSEQQQLVLCQRVLEQLQAAAVEGEYPQRQYQQQQMVQSAASSRSRRSIDKWVSTVSSGSTNRGRLAGAGAKLPRNHHQQQQQGEEMARSRGGGEASSSGTIRADSSGYTPLPTPQKSRSREAVKECVAASASSSSGSSMLAPAAAAAAGSGGSQRDSSWSQQDQQWPVWTVLHVPSLDQ